MSSASTKSNNAAYQIRKDKDNYVRSLFKAHNSLFPKIKKEDGFAALKSIDISQVPWPLYVMALSKTLIPDSKPRFPYEIESSLLETEMECDICCTTFVGNVKDVSGKSSIQDVHGLYKLYKSVNHLYKYPLCLACFYALQNPAVALDYPKNNRKDPESADYYTNTFCMLKRDSSFGYLGEMMQIESRVYYAICDIAINGDGEHEPEELNMDEFAR